VSLPILDFYWPGGDIIWALLVLTVKDMSISQKREPFHVFGCCSIAWLFKIANEALSLPFPLLPLPLAWPYNCVADSFRNSFACEQKREEMLKTNEP
jgi:hypothetical protein